MWTEHATDNTHFQCTLIIISIDAIGGEQIGKNGLITGQSFLIDLSHADLGEYELL